jgi:predicted Zn-dependent peptidase
LQLAASPAANDPDRYAARLLGAIMGDDSGSRLYWELVDPGLLEYAGMATYEYEGTGLMLTVLCCEAETGLQNLERLQSAQQKLAAEGITAKELERAKRKLISGLVLQSERPENRMFSIGNAWLVHGEYKTTRDLINSYDSVQFDDISRILTQYPYTTHYTVLVSPQEDTP